MDICAVTIDVYTIIELDTTLVGDLITRSSRRRFQCSAHRRIETALEPRHQGSLHNGPASDRFCVFLGVSLPFARVYRGAMLESAQKSWFASQRKIASPDHDDWYGAVTDAVPRDTAHARRTKRHTPLLKDRLFGAGTYNES
jgi:hypothetical protein